MHSRDVLAHFPDARQAGAGWTARCPAHGDKRASLSIGRGDDNRWLLHCHAGCALDAILDTAQLTTADIAPPAPTATKPTIVATYPYHDEAGVHRFDVIRFWPKDFRQRRADGAWSMQGVRRVLYRLAELQGEMVAYVVEGERDVDRLRSLGRLTATCNVGGAGKWRQEYTAQIKGAGIENVVVLPDNDDAGRKHAEDVARSCHAAGLRVQLVTLPDLPPKGDVSDWLDAGGTREQLVALVQQTALYEPAAATTKGVEGTKPEKPKQEKPKQGRAVQLEDPEPWADPVPGDALLDAIAETFERYAALPPHASTALALWTLHVFAFRAWFTSPFLALTSPMKRCGKTLLLIVLGALVPRRLFASNVTSAVLFRTIEKYGPTLLIDEADTFVRDSDELRGVLNSGHTKTTAVAIRAVGDDHDPRAFSTWCPKAIALIGKLPDTIGDRAIEVAMRRRTAGERIERLRQDRIEAECSDLRRQAARWAADHLLHLQDADPLVPAELHDRAADCWRPLLAVADAAGRRWSVLAREAATVLSGVSDDAADQPAAVLLLSDVQTIFGDREELSSAALVTALRALDSRPWATWGKDDKGLTSHALARLLKDFKIHPIKIRFGDDTLNGYTRRMFQDAWTRYTPSEVEHRNNVNNDGAKSPLFKPEHPKSCSSLKNEGSTNNDGLCSSVPVSEGGNGAAKGGEDVAGTTPAIGGDDDASYYGA